MQTRDRASRRPQQPTSNSKENCPRPSSRKSSVGARSRDDHHRLNLSNKSTQSGGSSSPPIELECDETMDGVTLPERQFDCEPFPSQPVVGKSSGSFIREIHGVVPSPLDEYEDLEVEEVEEGWQPADRDYFEALKDVELEYMADPYCLHSRQPYIKPIMRAVLFDWMMEVTAEFALKRETFHLAAWYVDRFLTLQSNVRKEEFQLVGLVAMYIAAKAEEIYAPKITDFAKSADNGYTLTQIRQVEQIMFKRLSWRMFPATHYNWTTWLMKQWDDYLAYHYAHVQPDEARLVIFKHPNQNSYRRFRETLQILDVSLLDPAVKRNTPRETVSGLLYLMLSKFFYESNYELFFDKAEPTYDYDNLSACFGEGSSARLSSQRQTEGSGIVQELYGTFIKASAEISSLEAIYASVAFFHPFLDFECNFELPSVCKTQNKARLESHYEEFLSYQTHNAGNVEFVSRRLKA
mmetsp:Transcript_9656/g.18848  ORF Transcript_9656/g.18848 Transcript_9656/m.18848 type:complete len:465 (+) Transcript_9656:41-1435(+)